MLFGYHKDRIFTEITENPEDRSEALYQWQKERRETIWAVTEIIRDVIRSIQSSPGRKWGASKKFALIRWSQEEKDCLKLHQLREDYHKNMLPLKEAINKLG
jgi:3-methyladenine DNA glycosylase AlkC